MSSSILSFPFAILFGEPGKSGWIFRLYWALIPLEYYLLREICSFDKAFGFSLLTVLSKSILILVIAFVVTKLLTLKRTEEKHPTFGMWAVSIFTLWLASTLILVVTVYISSLSLDRSVGVDGHLIFRALDYIYVKLGVEKILYSPMLAIAVLVVVHNILGALIVMTTAWFEESGKERLLMLIATAKGWLEKLRRKDKEPSKANVQEEQQSEREANPQQQSYRQPSWFILIAVLSIFQSTFYSVILLI